MSMTATVPSGLNLRALADAFAPTRLNFDPMGLVTGFRAYRIYSALDARSDAALTEMGLTRTDLPRVAMSAAMDTRA